MKEIFMETQERYTNMKKYVLLEIWVEVEHTYMYFYGTRIYSVAVNFNN